MKFLHLEQIMFCPSNSILSSLSISSPAHLPHTLSSFKKKEKGMIKEINPSASHANP